MRQVRDFQHLQIFQGLSEILIYELDAVLELNEFSDQETIFHQDDSVGNLHILLDGKVSISFKPYDGNALTIAIIESGGVFGWSAALGRETYSSSAVTMCESTTFSITRQNLQKICMLKNETGIIFLENLTSVITERLHQTHTKIFNMLSQASDLMLGEEIKL